MYFTAGNILLVGSILLFFSILIGKAGSRFGVPTLLLFLIAGMIFGTDGVGFEFSDEKQAQFIGMVAMSIILFSGGMGTRYSEIKPVLKQGIVLSTLGVILTTLITGTFIYLVTKSGKFAFIGSFPLCLLLAATMSSTDSASVFNILRTQNIGLRKHLQPMLELESGSNDPVAYMLTIALIQICNSPGDVQGWSIVLNFLMQIVIGAVLGFALGRATVWIMNKINLNNNSLYSVMILSIAFFIFSITELARGNGYLAVYLAGVVVGNRPLVKKRECAKFLDGMTWLSQIVMFLTLGLLVNPHELLGVGIISPLIALFVMFIARPLSVFIALAPFKKPAFIPKLYVSWVGLRGAAPILFATYPVVADVPGAKVIFNIVFFITILSLILQGTTVSWMAKILNMRRELPKEGNDFGIEFPEEIDSKLWDLKVTPDLLEKGNTLKEMEIPKGILVIMVKRGKEYLVPNGSLELAEGDLLLVVSQGDAPEEHLLQQ